MGDLSKNFSKHEFDCKDCCGQADIQKELINRLQAVRNELGRAIIITSGYRCITKNKAVGGGPYSSHLYGFAADIAVPNDHYRWLILPILARHFTRIWLYPTHIHVDCDPGKIGQRIGVSCSKSNPQPVESDGE